MVKAHKRHNGLTPKQHCNNNVTNPSCRARDLSGLLVIKNWGRGVLGTAFSLVIFNSGFPGQKITPAFAQVTFRDIQGHWAQGCIERLATQKIITGYSEDGTFRPNRPVSRAEFAAIVRRAFPNARPVRNPVTFIDIPTDYWAYQEIREAYQAGFVSGFSGSIFNPTLNVSRWQVLVSLANGLKYTTTRPVTDILQATFDDANNIPEGARNAVAAATEKQVVVNYPNVKQLNPNREATRAEVAAFLCQSVSQSRQTNLIASDYVAQIPRDVLLGVKKEIVESGNLRAEFAYEPQGENGKNLRLKIVRDGQTLLDNPVLIPVRSAGSNSGNSNQEQIADGRFLSMRILDLDRDNEPEILVDLVSLKDGQRCCNYSFIYRYEPQQKNYLVLKHFWGNVSYELQDLDRDGIPEFQSQDGRFAEAFASYADSRFPLKIWQYLQGKMQDVTRQYPVLVYTNASELWLESNQRQSNNQDVKGVLAAYLASQYILGQEAEGWQLVEKGYQGNDRSQFLAELRDFLTDTGYTNSEIRGQEQRETTEVAEAKPAVVSQTPATPSPRERPNSTRQTPATTPPQNRRQPQRNESVQEPKLLRTLTGHENPILSLAMSPDGTILAGGSQQEIKLWEVETGELLQTLSGHSGNVWSVAISPDGQILASGSGDGTVILWNLNTGEVLRRLQHTGGWVNAVGFSADGRTAISCSHNQGIKLWDVETGELINTLEGFNPMAIALQGRILASSGGPSAIKLWDLITGNLRNTLEVPAVAGGGIRALALSRDGWILAHAMSGNGSILVWDLRNQEVLYTLEGHADGVNALAISPNGQMLVSTGGDRSMKLWDLRTGKLAHSVEGLGAIAFSRDGQRLVNVSQDNSVQLWSLSGQ